MAEKGRLKFRFKGPHVHSAPSTYKPLSFKPSEISAPISPSYAAPSVFSQYRFVFFVLALGVVGIIGVLVTMDFIGPTDCGSDAQCFTQLANNCAPATMTTQISTVSLALSTKGCTLTKRVESLASEEPEPIRQYLVGKAMSCAFVQGGFDQEYVTTITGNLGTCTGDLRNAIEAILAA